MVKQRSHEIFTFHRPLPPDFNRRTVLPPEQMRLLRETASRNQNRRMLARQLRNEKIAIVGEIIDIIVKRAADDLFDTPVPTVIPTDSFELDYEIEKIEEVEKDLDLDPIETINKEASKKVTIEIADLFKSNKKKSNRKSRSKSKEKDGKKKEVDDMVNKLMSRMASGI